MMRPQAVKHAALQKGSLADASAAASFQSAPMGVVEEALPGSQRPATPADRSRYRALSLNASSMLMLVPAAFVLLVCFVLFIAWTFLISLTNSRLLPDHEIAGWVQYRRLFASEHWWTATGNLFIHAAGVMIGCILLGYALALLIDRGARWARWYRTVFLLPLSISFIVTGLIWRWLLDPGMGVQHALRDAGWTSFPLDWIVRPDRAIYTIVIASIWQHVGVSMLLFLAGLRGIDPNLWKIAQVDDIPAWRMYVHVITPLLRPAFYTAAVLIFCMAVKTFDVVVILTSGGPGFSSDLPARFVVELMQRQELGMGAAGACMLLAAVAAAIGPHLYIESRRKRRA